MSMFTRHDPFSRRPSRSLDSRPWRASLLFAWILTTGCHDADDASSYDTEGAPQWNLVEQVRMGSVEDLRIGFSQIADVGVDDTGRTYALDAQERIVRVFEPDGAFVRSFGREGAGPGEFEFPIRLRVVGDTVQVFDVSTQRITLFSPGGDVLATVPAAGVQVSIPDVPGGVRMVPMVPSIDGRFGPAPNWGNWAMDSPLPDSVLLPALRFNTAGEVVDTVGWFTAFPPPPPPTVDIGGRTVFLTNAPAAEAPLEVQDGDRRVTVRRERTASGDPPRFLVSVFRDGSGTEIERSYTYQPIPRDVDAVIAGLATPLMQSGLPEGEVYRAIERAVDVPEFLPPVREGKIGKDGSMWFRLSHAPQDSSATWLVLDETGVPMGEFSLPTRTRLMFAADTGRMWAAESDSLGVPWLVVYGFEK